MIGTTAGSLFITLPSFPERFAGLALFHIGESPDGMGTGVVRLETFPKGRVFHVLSILSPGDPRPPFVS